MAVGKSGWPRVVWLPRVGALVIAAFLLGTLARAESGADQRSGNPGPGVSRELAISRAAIVSGLRYHLDLSLRAHVDAMSGHELLEFDLPETPLGRDLLLDFRQGSIQSATLNGAAIGTTLADGHLAFPATMLRPGRNTVEMTFSARIAAAGAAITRYDDKEDGSEYLYSLFVPMDASMAFPCFDQPDLKARFKLSISAPSGWTAIGNSAPESVTPKGELSLTRFLETKPISTYLFAFTAGPWTKVHPSPGQPDVYVRRSQRKRAEPEAPQLQAITARGMAWLADYFQQPFPFPKYDLVLIPGFPFGGMEHAGATFLSEDAILFRSAPTTSDRFRRDILTLHELTHQWFGDLVTMRWFDDLWLKEGFAQYMAYRCLDTLDPTSQAWKHFFEDIKPLAYGIDETEGTTPIFQDIPNLKDAKSAYGAIVYQKAPAILKQLEFRLGPDSFRGGLRLYLAQHAYANARWSDLIDAFHTASGQDVRTWADAWVPRRGMPEITATWSCDAEGSRIAEFKLRQRDVLPDGLLWPISNEVLLEPSGERLRVNWSTAEIAVPEAVGKACPRYVFGNASDFAYGRFLLDAASERAVRQVLAPAPVGSPITQGSSSVPDPLLRSMLWGALWDNVHVAASPPRGYVELVLRTLPLENDETLARIQGGHATTALERYMTDVGRAAPVQRMETIATDRMLHAPAVGLRIVSFRTLTGVAESSAGRDTLKRLLTGEVTVPEVTLRQLDRWNLVGRLVALGDPEAAEIFAAETRRDHTGDAEKFAFAALAGAPDPGTKQRYFAQYLLPPTDRTAKPEDWLTQSLHPFNGWNQAALTAPYLRRSLDQLAEIKRDRKIFYLGAWLGAFVGGQISPESATVVRQWLAQGGIDPDLRRKVLENADELERTVRIRQRFPD